MKGRKDWGAIIKRYESRSGTVEQFAVNEGVKPATLQYHVSKKRKQSDSFRPVLVEQIDKPPSEVSIELCSGVKVTIRG